MATIKEIKVPDIGDFTDVPVIEVLIQPGDTIKVEDPLITIESDKATMEVPSPEAGIVKELKIKVGDNVSQGVLILLLESADAGGEPAAASVPTVSPAPAAVSAPAGVAEVRVPDIGDFTDVPVIEVLVKPGDTVKAEDPLITLESDKATMEVPAPLGGVVQEIKVKVGDSVSQGVIILTLATGDAPAAAAARPSAAAPAPTRPSARGGGNTLPASAIDESAFLLAYAGPAVRKLARDLGVDLGKVPGSGDKGRILSRDVEAFAKRGAAAPAPAAAAPASGAGTRPAALAEGRLREIRRDRKPAARRASRRSRRANLHRNWVDDPARHHPRRRRHHRPRSLPRAVEQGKREGRRQAHDARLHDQGGGRHVEGVPRVQRIARMATTLILKQYFHIGFAADTPNGLVVPVIRDADKKGVVEIAKEMGELAKLAREGKLEARPDAGRHASRSSSLGGIGGTYFTPIINAPEVAIMGVCKILLEAGLRRRQAIGVAPHAAVVAVLGSPRNRRRRRRALQRPFRQPARRSAARALV